MQSYNYVTREYMNLDFAGTVLVWTPLEQSKGGLITRRTWECNYCGSENDDGKLDCPQCGANRSKAVRAVA